MGTKNRTHIQVLLLILICGSAGFAQSRQSGSRQAPARRTAPFLQYVKSYEETQYVTKVVLKNGITVLVDEFRAQPVVCVQVHVRAGYLDEPARYPGTARLVARMIQRGAPDRSGSFRQQVHALGGTFRSVTDYTATLFEIVAPSNQWKQALTVQAEAIQNPSFDASSVEIEEKLLRSEARSALEEPRELGDEKMLALATGQAGMAKLEAIRSAAAESIALETIVAFYRAQYIPSRTMLVVSGDINSSEILNEVVRLYAKQEGSGARSNLPATAGLQADFRFDSMRLHVPTPQVLIGFQTVPEKADDYRALEVLSAMIGMGESSVLASRLRDQKKLIFWQETRLRSHADFGYLSIHAGVDAARIDRAEIAILTELELLKREEPTEIDMMRAFALMERAYWKELETASGRAGALAVADYLGDWKRVQRRLTDLRKVKAADVKRVASRYLRLQNCTLLEFLPVTGDERIFTESIARRTLDALIIPSADEEQAQRSKEPVLGVATAALTGGFKFSEIRYPFQTASILRGPDLFIREDHINPLIETGLFFPGGKLDEKKDNGGITNLMTLLLLGGGAEAGGFFRQLEVYGGQVQPVVTDDYFGFYLSVLAPNFEAAFKLLLDNIRTPAFEKEAVERQKEILLSGIGSLGGFHADPLEQLNQDLFDGFPYSMPGGGTETSIGSITPEALNLWYEAHVRNRKPVAVMIGDTKGTSLASVFVKNFSGSRMQDIKLPGDYAKSLEKAKSIDRKWIRGESVILVGFRAPPVDDEDGYAAAILEAYAGDNGKVSQELRDKVGNVRRVSTVYRPRLRGGSLVVEISTSPGREEEALDALREEIGSIREGPIPYRDFRSAVNEAVGTYTIRQQARSVQIANIAVNVMSGKGIDGYQNHLEGLKDVREEDFKETAQRILNLEKAVVLVMRGAK